MPEALGQKAFGGFGSCSEQLSDLPVGKYKVACLISDIQLVNDFVVRIFEKTGCVVRAKPMGEAVVRLSTKKV